MAVRDITGNRRAKDIILSAATGEKTGTSYIISGEPGTGKNFSAIQFAKALNCLEPAGDGDCCDKCSNCRLIERVFGDINDDGMQQHPHPDTLYVNTEKAQLSIELVRKTLSEMNSYRAIKLKKKIVIIKDAERMNKPAANSILKELEEPNDSVVIMLIVNSIEKMLSTIISRCRKIEIKRAGLKEVEESLRKTADFSGEEELKDALMFCEGKIGDAFDYEKIKEVIKLTKPVFNVLAAKQDDIEGFFKELSDIEKLKRAKQKEKEESYRLFLLDILKMLSYIYRDLMLEKLEIKNTLMEKYGIDAGSARNYSVAKIAAILKIIEAAQRDLMANANFNILFNNLFFSIRKEGLNP